VGGSRRTTVRGRTATDGAHDDGGGDFDEERERDERTHGGKP